MSSDTGRLKGLSPAQKRALLQAVWVQRQQAPAAGAAPAAVATAPNAEWIVPLAARPAAATRVICFPHGAAGAASFRTWPELLPPDIEPLAVQLPGRAGRAREPFAPDLETAVEAIVVALAPLLDRPFLFYGHSLGAVLAFATATALRTGGLRMPEALVLAAAAPPGDRGRFGPSPTSSDAELLRCASGIDLRHVTGDPRARLELLQCLRADSILLSGWADRRIDVLDVPITALAGRDDECVPPAAVAGWRACTSAPFDFRTLPGPHLFHLIDARSAVDVVCRAAASGPARSRLGAPAMAPAPRSGVGLSLFFFSSTEVEHDVDKYRLVDAAVQFADRAGFEAVWLPERHFHPVGGLFPNPSVLAAAVAATTRRLRIRSGSVVLPLHDPMRVAEEWSVVDNLSGGRVDMGVVPGWNPNDYALAPTAYARRWAQLFEHLDVVRRLWRGEPVTRVNGCGEDVSLRLHPRPLQPELPVWVATSANDDSFVRAGELGLNVLTALLIQSVDDFARRVGLYRDARARAGHDPAGGAVTLMVQACIGSTDADVRRVVRDPFLAYMRSVQSLWKDTVEALRVESAAQQEALLDMVFERYYQRSTLFGSLDTCLERVAEYERAGATELACMIDFGLPYEENMASLGWLDRLRAHHAGVQRPLATS
jgi:natural product biosynthesis luciferase-like monooxygenase protein